VRLGLSSPTQSPRHAKHPPRHAKHSPRGGKQLPRGGKKLPRGGKKLPRGGKKLPRGGKQLPRGGKARGREGKQLPRGGKACGREGKQSPRDGKQSPRDGKQSPRDGKHSPRVAKQSPRDGKHPPRDGRLRRVTIRFYSVGDAYGEFSNFALFPITLQGARWPTTEHFFQGQKFDDARYRETIRKANTPMIAARLGRDRKQKLRRDWESVKVSVMREALRAKFTQHPELRALLLSTCDTKLVEHTENDAYWGDGGDGSGRNMLGQLLMELRAALQTL
jgi:ribA/ribD-fused uncharacterized protein